MTKPQTLDESAGQACVATKAAAAGAAVPDDHAQIERLKREQDAVILAHYYVPPEVQAVADHVGDSFALARMAVDLP